MLRWIVLRWIVLAGLACSMGCAVDDDGPSGPAWRTVFEPGDIGVYSGQLSAATTTNGSVWLGGDNFVIGRVPDGWRVLDAEDSGTDFRGLTFAGPYLVGVGDGGVISSFYNGVSARSAPQSVTLHGVWGVHEETLWVVGGDTTAALFAPDDSSASRFVDETPTNLPGPLYAIDGTFDESELITVGDGGAIYEYDGTAWQLADSPTVASLRDVTIGSDSVIAVGEIPAVVLERTGGTWVDITPPGMGGAPRAVSISDRGDVCVVGLGGLRFRRVDGEWLDESDGAPGDLVDVVAVGAEIFAVSAAGGVVHYGASPVSSTIVP